MSGYAVKRDGSGWRSVDGPSEDPENPSKIFPDPEIEFYSESIPDDPVPSPEQTLSIALEKRDSLLAYAALRIAPLQDAVDLDSATDEEVTRLKAWKQYRVVVNRVSSQEGWPGLVDWPSPPRD
ncbi:tail fiber assembly protein [Pseudomonas sp. MSSRFD41]|uniref:tail fiber assembly protein n=1 Tax=Pseudomonas sp. MSSRFD41 TaxID=1310370 RepID=UPI00163B1D32|nr:tail fiber assembly protein [Pseudomonas sp. MSSRFD41]MBC2659823.1 tail fiber assembly protein [Pseudomonas sp. MSSRFD41]